MKYKLLAVVLFIPFVCGKVQIVEKIESRYQPTWESLDTRPLPKWFDEAKVGIFLHWGVFSVPSFGSEWFWTDWLDSNQSTYAEFMKKNYPPNFTYQDFARDFTAEFFDPDEWAELFRKAGARYVVLTTKHHEGFTLWPSKYSFGWNAKDVGPRRDLVGDLAEAVRSKNLTFGVYHSLYEWYNPIYQQDKRNLFLSNDFVKNKVIPEMKELINSYKPWVLWSDGDWETFDFYWNSTEFLAWLYNESPVKDTIVTNDRWGIGIPCKHGDFYSCKDRYNPGVLQKHKWENAMTLDKESWGFRRNANVSSYLTTHELIKTLAETVSCGGNLLINVGPTKEGTIAPIFQDRLLNLGKWLDINGEAIYGCQPWQSQNDTLTPGVWYTKNNGNLYAIVLQWPKHNVLKLQSISNVIEYVSDMQILGNTQHLKWKTDDTGAVNIHLLDKAAVSSDLAWVIKIIPSRDAR